MDTNEQILSYLKGNIDRKEVFVDQTEKYLEIVCEIKSKFISPNEYTRVKGYLRRNGFQSDWNGTHTRYNEGHQPKPLGESMGDLMREYEKNIKIAYLKELIEKAEAERTRALDKHMERFEKMSDEEKWHFNIQNKYLGHHIDRLKAQLIIDFNVIID
jgi:hypothetical protein